jgi:microcin C transport system permease protein
MTNKHIFLFLIALLLFDPIRLNLFSFAKRFGWMVLGVIALIAFLIKSSFATKVTVGVLVYLIFFKKINGSIQMFYMAFVDYFTSPIFKKRAKKFTTLKRGYYSFIAVVCLYCFSFLLPLFMTNQAWYASYNGESYFPAIKGFFKYYTSKFIKADWEYYGNQFGLDNNEPVNFRKLAKEYKKMEKEGKKVGTVVLAPYPYGPNESNMEEYPDKEPPHRFDKTHWFGTDDRGRDVLARLAYGFNISMTFALGVVIFSYLIGVSVGACLGYYGGTFDIIVQRFVEIWSAMPFLYTVMIVVSVIDEPSPLLLWFCLVCFGWMGMTYYIRGEFLREKAKDYVSAAISIGVKDHTIIFKHILPNALTPIISFLPFAIVGQISALVSLDFLGFGLPAPTPSWGELLSQGMAFLKIAPWLVFGPLGCLFITLLLVSFIGEAVREAFDPKQYSRLK